MLNRKLFSNQLPRCLITLTRKNQSLGYFSKDRWQNSNDRSDIFIHEIAMNPKHFESRGAKDTLSTLAHEMCHLWQAENGKPSGAHHNKEWGAKMIEIGLMPSATGEPGGKRTGQKMTHYVIDGNPFDVAADQLIDAGWHVAYNDRPELKPPAKSGKRTKYTCPMCDTNVWGKADLTIVCGDCDEAFESND